MNDIMVSILRYAYIPCKFREQYLDSEYLLTRLTWMLNLAYRLVDNNGDHHDQGQDVG